MKTIVIDLDGDLDKAIAEINELKSQIERFPIEIATEGAMYAEQRYDTYTADTAEGNQVGYGKSGVYVQAEPSERKSGGAVIHAHGEEIGFAEYGTGRHAEFDSKAPIPTGSGTWSVTDGGHFAKRGYWRYNNTIFYGSYPTYAMTHTIEYLRENTVSIARNYFK